MSLPSHLSWVPRTPHLRVGSWVFPQPLGSPRLCIKLFS
jgi:hypothetical protein